MKWSVHLCIYIYSISGCLRVCVCVCVCVCVSECLFVWVPFCLSVCLSLSLSLCLSVRLSVRPSVRLSVYLSLSIYLSTYLSLSLSLSPSLSLSLSRFVRSLIPNCTGIAAGRQGCRATICGATTTQAVPLSNRKARASQRINAAWRQHINWRNCAPQLRNTCNSSSCFCYVGSQSSSSRLPIPIMKGPKYAHW